MIYKYLQNSNNHYRATFPLHATTETQEKTTEERKTTNAGEEQ
jgi:hypothetical protein